MEKTTQKTLSSTKTLSSPFIVLILVVFLLLFGGRFAYGFGQNKIAEFKKATDEKTVLETKKQTLQNIKNLFDGSIETPVIALPDKNATLWVIGNLRSLSGENALNISSVEMKEETLLKNDLYQVIVSHEVEVPTIEALVSYLNSLTTVAPVIALTQVNINAESAGGLTAEVELATFYSPFPSTLPSLTSPVSELTSSESQLLNQLSELKKPNFTSLTPVQNFARENPFN